MADAAVVRNSSLHRIVCDDLLERPAADVAEQAGHAVGAETPNTARFVFLNPVGPEFLLDFDKIQDDAVAYSRAEAERDPYDKDLQDLIGELFTRSERFRQRWAAHDVRYHRTGAKRLHHPLVGDLTLDFEALELPGDEEQRLNVYTAPPDSPTGEALDLLASWTLPRRIVHREGVGLGDSEKADD